MEGTGGGGVSGEESEEVKEVKSDPLLVVSTTSKTNGRTSSSKEKPPKTKTPNFSDNEVAETPVFGGPSTGNFKPAANSAHT